MIKTSRVVFIDSNKFDARKLANTTHLVHESKFNFLRDHYGLRPCNMHIILGTTGSGKSTLVRSILAELINAKKKVLIYSCEETVEDFETQFSYSKDKQDYKNLLIFHESEMRTRTKTSENVQEFIKQLELSIIEHKPDVFIFDNITTSDYYEQNKNAAKTAQLLQELCLQSKIPFLVVAHTSADVKGPMFFDSSSIRGLRTITNKAQYVYCYYRFRENIDGYSRILNFIYTDKSRMHSEASKSCYKLFFDNEQKLFTSDVKVDFELFNEFTNGKKVRGKK